MDTKSMHCKHPKKMKTSKDKHEVFVLPPDLLKKLGISIGNINGSQEIPADGSGSPSTATLNNDPYEYLENIPASNNNQKPTDTSILETASLMKKSVFLSPTFVSTTTNAIAGEVEISRKNIVEDLVPVCSSLEPQDSVFEPSDNIEVTKLISDSNDIRERCLKVNQYDNCMNGEQISEPNINQEQPYASLDGNENPVIETNMTFDENLIALESKISYGSDNDYSFKGETIVKVIERDTVSSSFNDDTNNIPAPKSSKIDIISDETIPLSKLREMKRSKRRSLNGKKIKPETVQSIAKMTIKTGNSGLQNIMEPNPAVPLDNTKILKSDLDEVDNEENTVLSKLKSRNTNELIEVTAMSSPKSLKDTEVIRTDIISNTTESVTLLGDEENVKDHMNRTTSKYESPDKQTEAFEEDNTKNDCELYENKTLGDVTTVNGLDEDKEVIINDVDKSVTICNGQKDECNELAGIDGVNKQNFANNQDKCNNDKVDQVCPVQGVTVIKDHTTVEHTLKSKSNTKKSRNSKNTCDSSSGVKKITVRKNSSKNEENKTEHDNELNSILNATKKLSSDVADIKVDKVKEIAAYLRKFSHIYTDKKKTKKALSYDITKKEKVNSNINTIESKLCIQGVEKPGGTEVVREHNGECKVLKTYARRNPSKASKLSALMLNKNETCNTVDALDLDLDTVNISTCEMQQFCLCDDFGRLAYYDRESFYEHIHFWHHHTENCELDLIFAIYSDEAVVSNSESVFENEKEEKTEEKIEAYNVCWNIFQSEFSENVDNSETELIGHKYVISEVNDANVDVSPQVPELNIAQKVDDGIVPKFHEVQTKNNSHSDIILEIINHDMVDAAESKNSDSIRNIGKSLNTDINDNNSPTVGSEEDLINKGLNSSQFEQTATSASKIRPLEISNVLEKSSSDAKEKTHQHRKSSINENTFSRKEVTLDSPKTSNITAPKRKLSGNARLATESSEPSVKKSVKCGLCNNIFSGAEWEQHVADQHHLIAWPKRGSIDLDDPKLVQKLKENLKTAGLLECSLCCMQYKKFSRFMEHIKYCIRKKLSNEEKKLDKPARKSRTAVDESVTCGVCQRTMLSSNWLEHIGSLHDYLAWKEGQVALNLDKESEVWQHLQNIIRLHGSLTCYKCGLQRSRVQVYLAHIKTCNGTREFLDQSSMSVDLNSSSSQEPQFKVEIVETSNVKCGVCEQEVAPSDWIEHISKTHNYLAWQEGQTRLDLDDEEAVRNHLQQFIRQIGGLTCHKCGLVRKRVKLYLAHIETCDGINISINNSSNNIDMNSTANSTNQWYEVPIEKEKDDKKVVKCGVCSEEVPILDWVNHAGKEHDYMAWQEGTTPLDLENELAVKVHLLDMSKLGGGLVCNKCEKRLKYPKTYLQHTKDCTGPTGPEAKLELSTSSWIESFCNNEIKNEILTCGVCESNIESEKWFDHIETEHQYLAWVKDQPPLNVENAAMVQKHLNEISKVVGGLKCAKCGVKRKYVKWYLLHIDTCQGRRSSTDLSNALMSRELVECAVCGETMEPKEWRSHAMRQHYNIAWVVGDNPIEINNPYAVESYLKEYQHVHNKLVCKVCKISRVSYVGFYAHIIVCGKTEEETEIYKSVCDICNNKYLRIYKSQHMTMHREKEYAKERKLLAAKEQAIKKEDETLEVVIQTGRRKAAEKAKNVIENYKKNFHDGSYNCSKCGFTSEAEKDLADHVCIEDKWDASDSDESVKSENFSGDETDETDIDSNVSDEEREAREQASSLKKKKHSDSSTAKVCRLPFQVTNTSSYLKRSTEEFIDTYLTDEDLFPLWHNCELEEVPENELVYYMPPVEESCKVRFDENQDWLTFNRLESTRVKDTTVVFLGASMQCMSWVPPAAEPARATSEPHYLSVATHRSDDAPRHAWDVTLSERGLIQLWDCANLIATTPQFVLGIAHNLGTVWAIDWCPSGARDVFDLDTTPAPNTHRLGLMAAACSNGLAYIFVVPYPSSITEKEKPFYKLKPVVELRLASNENRRVYQATAVKWSVQKGHSHVVVGYADGTTAYYDLNGESPILRTTENNRTVLYPYHDERVQNSCIEDMDMYPSGVGSRERAGGVVCAGSAGGAGAGALQSHVAAAKVLFPPHWPAALLAGDDCLVKQSINELEWWGGGRRLGGSCSAAGCAWCGRVCVSAPPLLRQMRVHPCFPDLHKQVIARILMIPFGAKRKRQNDELAMIVEPIAYSDAVKKYGLEFKQITAKDRTTQQKLSATPRVAYPERFPLSDVAAMKFCPTFRQHHKLAVGMHSGLIFIINV
ncbi:hypothetical protein PYW07_000944 [Mythimna separata]|uniref:C2H2-type domain-containing protein n=1 Tax=Mythimna separata TaxID=271217 RepID=A0AAD7YU26_MYTSE|nr:hypothetical protein PYW07_000944 [Mythimna separata]